MSFCAKNCCISIYNLLYIYDQIDTNTHFLPIFRVSLQPNHSMNISEILFGVSSLADDYLYKFLALQFNRNIPFSGFENRDFGKFPEKHIIYAGKLYCRNFVFSDLELRGGLLASGPSGRRLANHRERLPAF